MSDHRDIIQQLDLAHVEQHSPGVVFWHPRGWTLYRVIQNYIREVHAKYGYNEVRTPALLSKTLWQTSGHWDKFKENMFVTGDMISEDENGNITVDGGLALKPMSCPGQIQIFNHSRRSHNEFPIRYFEFGNVFRNESSGSLSGIARVRNFEQDDSHIFLRKHQILEESKNFINMAMEIYAKFGFNISQVKISTRGENNFGSSEMWDTAEALLMQACDSVSLKYDIQPGEAAFYGPKLEIQLQDSLGRFWQCGTLQLDFVLPVRFNLGYQHEDGNFYHSAGEKYQHDQVVMLHHAVLGSLERFISILLENSEDGKLPVWLSPTQVVVCSISEKSAEYASSVGEKLKKFGIRVEVDNDAEKITAKIRKHSVFKIPLILVVGEKEMVDNTVAVRKLGSNTNEVMSVGKFIEENF